MSSEKNGSNDGESDGSEPNRSVKKGESEKRDTGVKGEKTNSQDVSESSQSPSPSTTEEGETSAAVEEEETTEEVLIPHSGKSQSHGAMTVGSFYVPKVRSVKIPPTVPILPQFRRPLFPRVTTAIPISDKELLKKLMARKNAGLSYVGVFLQKPDVKGAVDSVTAITDPDILYDIGILARMERIVPNAVGMATLVVTGVTRVRIDREKGTVVDEEGKAVDDASAAATAVDDCDLPQTEQTSEETVAEAEGEEVIEPTERTEKAIKPQLELPEIAIVKVTDVGQEDTVTIRAYVGEIVGLIKELTKSSPLFKDQLQIFLESVDFKNASQFADLAACLTTSDSEALQEVVEERDVAKRLGHSHILLTRELELAKVQQKIKEHLSDQIEKSQRTHLLNEQLKAIKKELGIEKDEKESLTKKFQDRIDKLTIRKEAKKVIDEEMNKLSLLDPASSEYNVVRNYLEWMTQIPWGVFTEDMYDVKRAKDILDQDHYGLKDVKERILEYIAVGKLRGSLSGQILCFVGPPGVGKTSIGKSIGKALNREFFRFSVGGLSDVAEIKGHRRTYLGAMPGKLVQCLKRVQSSNPVIMIDEVDKLSKGHQGDPASALLEVLDPQQNSDFLDHYLDVPVDLSKVMFVCTANSVDTIPQPLLDRMEVIRLSGYDAVEKKQIASKYLIPTARKESGLEENAVEIDTGALEALLENYCREAGVRNLQKHIEKVLRKAAYKTALGEEGKILINAENLHDFVGKKVFHNENMYEVTPPGVVMGLAWTSMGGSSLYIETVAGGEKASIQTTGKMGDVMKESTAISYTFAKRLLEAVDPSNEFFSKKGVHMHIPEGATPKDGPSAGVTMVTSLISLAMNKPVKQCFAMTGELTVTGKVLAIGGLKEKVLAAKRAGVKHVMFPKANKYDWEELEDHVREGVTAYFVETYADVYRVAFGEEPPASL